MQQVQEALERLGVNDVRLNDPLARHTTWKVGGPADLLIYPHSQEELRQTLVVLREHQIPWMVIGRGSNLLVRDGGIRGAVIKVGKGLDHLQIEGDRVTVGGGYSTILLAAITAKKGLMGLEFAGGIPGNIGGAVYMNAGAHGSEIANVLTEAEILLETGETVRLTQPELKFRYRTSILQEELHGVVTEAVFQLQKGEREEIMARLSQFKEHRRKTQPLQHPCAGSVFRNPPGTHAGKLIEEAGLKGFQIGGAQISTLHGNFLINTGDAKAEDLIQLIKHIQQVIWERFEVKMIPEVHVVGEEANA